jgi:predicted lysophospholipase L1 biosynthesis ABC-type transport system permease subunit
MAEHTRRIGLLKAIGGTPGLVTLVLLAENVVLAVLAAAAGLAIGWLAAPLIASPGAALIGAPGAPSLSLPIVVAVVAMALLVARRPRRAVLTAGSMAVAVTGVVAVLAFHATAGTRLDSSSGLSNPVIDRDEQMLTVLTLVRPDAFVYLLGLGAWQETFGSTPR